MNLKQTISLAILIGGITLCGESSLVHAIEHEQEWMESWGGSSEDYFNSVASIPDGGFIGVGHSNSTDGGVTNQGYNDAIIIKYDQKGNQQWMNSWGGATNDYFTSVIPTSDGGCIAVGYSQSTNAGFTNQGDYDGIIVKYDSDGNQEWMNSWGGSHFDSFASAFITSDNGVIVVGNSQSTNGGVANQGYSDGIIIKYDTNGNQKWVKSWGGANPDYFNSITPTSDGGFVVVGMSNSTNIGFNNRGGGDAVIIKYNANGDQEWVKSWGGTGYEFFRSITQTSDGGLVVVGESNSTNGGFTSQGGYDGIIVKYDSDGNQEWMNSWGGDSYDYLTSVIETSDGGLLAAGYSYSVNAGFSNQGSYDATLIKYDQEGNQEWIDSWGGTNIDHFCSIVPTLNSGFIVAGFSNSTDAGFNNQGKRDAIIVKYSPKTDADIQINGNIRALMADVTLPSTSPDLVINPNLPDGAMSPEFGITNDSTSPIKLDLRTFEQTTNTFNDVLPNKYDSWEGLNKTQSQDLALGLIAKEGNSWQRLTTPISYVAGHSEHEIGVIKSASSVSFEFDVHHGRAFSEAKTVQYRMVFVFDLLS